MELKRLALIQKNYPIERTFIEEDFEGNVTIKKGFMEVPLKDFDVEQDEDGKKIKLNFRKGGYTNMKITKDILRFNVDLIIEGATTAEERDIIEQKNFMEDLQVLLTVPSFINKITATPDKFNEYLLGKMNIPEEDVFDDPTVISNKMHPALKEITAIQLVDVLKQQGINIPDDIPENEDYEPQEYIEIYNAFQSTDAFKELKPKQKTLFNDRLKFHNDNNVNPYFQEMRQAEKLKEQEAQIQEQHEAGQLPAPTAKDEEAPRTQSVRSQAGKLASTVTP
jgi:hypothetical protein